MRIYNWNRKFRNDIRRPDYNNIIKEPGIYSPM